MLLDVVPLVQQLVPGLLTHKRPSVACIRTTRTKYLVFDADSTRPSCVVEFGTAERLLRVDRVLRELHRRLPGGVPRSLVCAPWRHGYVHIQEGLPGLPWFRVADACGSAVEWRRLLGRAVDVMSRLHAAIAGVPQWAGTVCVPFELQRQVRRIDASGISLPPGTLQNLAACSELFGSSGGTPGISQHGDFSMNNLLVAADTLAVIDFDEFGSTFVPLHDAFGLALSLPLSQAGRCPLSLAECVAICLEETLTRGVIEREQVPSLLLHHLLWRINQCDGLPGRAALRRILLGWVEELSTSPAVFLGSLNHGAAVA